MPELPEVEITRRGISPDLVGKKLTGVIARTRALRYPLPAGFDRLLTGELLRDIQRRGKYLLLDFGKGKLLVHLGMSGTLRLVPASQPALKHDHVDLIFGRTALRMRDPRRFGAMLWVEGSPETHRLLAVLGIEPLSEEFTAEWLHQATRGLKAAVKIVLMDSHRVVGVGNIYASESLYRAGIDPRTPAGRISLARYRRLVPAIKETLARAIEAGGSSLRDFVHSDGSSGYFQLQAGVYGREGEGCLACGTPIRMIRQGQRATFYCPGCQR
jgi:formamidopyrimidine-DNA glycosylase